MRERESERKSLRMEKKNGGNSKKDEKQNVRKK